MTQAIVITALDQSINDAHGRFIDLGEHNRDGLISQINAAREVGHLLNLRKEKLKHGEWLKLFATSHGKPNVAPVLHFDYSTGRIYMALAKKLKEPITELKEGINSVKDAMIAVGALPAPERDGQHVRGLGPLSTVQRRIMRFVAILNKEQEKKPVEQWPRQQRDNLKQELAPLVKLYERL